MIKTLKIHALIDGKLVDAEVPIKGRISTQLKRMGWLPPRRAGYKPPPIVSFPGGASVLGPSPLAWKPVACDEAGGAIDGEDGLKRVELTRDQRKIWAGIIVKMLPEWIEEGD